MSENLYLRMHMLKCDMSEWLSEWVSDGLSDEPPEMLELLFATKHINSLRADAYKYKTLSVVNR